MKLKTFSADRLRLLASVPPKVNVSSSSSTSDIDMVVMAVWFSETVRVEAMSIDGASLIEFIVIFTSADEVLSPCNKV